jgi:hypothetical protein
VPPEQHCLQTLPVIAWPIDNVVGINNEGDRLYVDCIALRRRIRTVRNPSGICKIFIDLVSVRTPIFEKSSH